jgi:hypothetical protein
VIDDIFEIPIIDIGTGHGEGELRNLTNWSSLRMHSIDLKKHTLSSEA